MIEERFTASGVRLRLRHRNPGALTWLLLPGGPGLGSESLHELADLLAPSVPGEIWMVDLPGDGSNASALADPFARWPQVLLEAVEPFERCVFVGHSTGGMYLLSTPALEQKLAGLALVSSAPDTGWRAAFGAMCEANPLPAVTAASASYEADKNAATLRDLAVASAEWNFGPSSVARGRELLARMPYCVAAVEWSAREFDDVYAATWWPRSLPTLIVSGEHDRIVDQSAWAAPRYAGEHVLWRTIAGGEHFAWLEAPDAVVAAFAELAARLG